MTIITKTTTFDNFKVFLNSHRYTGKRICAIPCDGVDDLCLNNEDEDCQESFVLFVVAAILLCVALTVGIGESAVRFLISKEAGNDCELVSDDQNADVSVEQFLEDFISENVHPKRIKYSFKVGFT